MKSKIFDFIGLAIFVIGIFLLISGIYELYLMFANDTGRL